MATNRIVIPYAPRRVFLPFHNRKERFAVGVAHRRCGKTVACINDLIKRGCLLERSYPPGRLGYIGPQLNQSKDNVWQYLKYYAGPLIREKNEADLWVELLNGARIRLYGADNPDRIRGAYFDHVILDEYADMAPSVWGTIVRPMLADYQGGATFIGTPKGRNAFYNQYIRAKSDQNWFTFFLKASETGILPESELADARKDMTPEEYDQEFECSFEAAIMGAYYGKEMGRAEREGRLKPELDKIDGPIHCVWDFGNGANMAIWAFQVSPKGPVVHDFIQISGFYFEDYLKEVDRRGYHGFDYVPHDAKVPSFETGRTRIETMIGFKRKPKLIADHDVDDGINAGKLTLNTAVFNATACAPGLEALRQYRQEWDEKARVFKTTPKHDWASHPADAWRYLAMAWKERIAPTQPAEIPPVKAITDYKVEEMWNFNKRGARDRV